MEPSFGERIRTLRKQKGWTQRDLAGKAGIDFTYLSKIENDKEPASEKTILALANALGADSEELVMLARKVPAIAREEMTATPGARMFLRTARGLTEDDWKKLLETVKAMRKKK